MLLLKLPAWSLFNFERVQYCRRLSIDNVQKHKLHMIDNPIEQLLSVIEFVKNIQKET